MIIPSYETQIISYVYPLYDTQEPNLVFKV